MTYQRDLTEPVQALHLFNASRLGEASFDWHGSRARIEQLIGLAVSGLPKFFTGGRCFHTIRGQRSGGDFELRGEGDNLRYAAICALGLAFLDDPGQRACLAGMTAAALSDATAKRAEQSSDDGSVALAAWAAAEACGNFAAPLFERLAARLATGQPIETVICAWALCAALAANGRGRAGEVLANAARRLLEAQDKQGIFPHLLPARAAGRLRAHVGCFADQVYPIQALARLAVATGNAAALEAASRCADRICKLQGAAGQWWWHYDARNGGIVEGYPVYSVHQHAMGPMALFDLLEAGGPDHRAAIAKGVDWLYERPESKIELVSEKHGVVWRKIGRKEPPKLARKISAVTTAIIPGFHLPGLDALLPPTEPDYECRPYEFGWLLYAWLGDGTVSKLRAKPKPGHA